MKKMIPLFVALLAAAAAYAAAPANFLEDWDAARKAAAETHKPIYIHFSTTWCTWCRKMEQDTYGDSKVKAALQRFVPASLDCTTGPQSPNPSRGAANNDLMDYFGGTGYPFLVITTPEKAVLAKATGYMAPAQILPFLEKGRQMFDRLQQSDAHYQTVLKEGGYDDTLKDMRFYAEVQLWDEASRLAARVKELDKDNAKGDRAEADWVEFQAAASHKPTSPDEQKQREDRMRELSDAIHKLDADNTHGILARLLRWETNKNITEMNGVRGSNEKTTHADAAAQKLEELQKVAPKASGIQTMWVDIGDGYAKAGHNDKAAMAYQKAIDPDPNGRAVESIKQKMAALKGKGGK